MRMGDDEEDESGYIKIGPVGNRNGHEWDEKGHTNIVQIFISYDDEIRSLQFQYAENGALLLSQRHGANTGNNFGVVKLNQPLEYIKSVSGYKSHHDDGEICSITFGTNFQQYGPFGKFSDKDQEFSLSLGEGRQFAGFHGTADRNNLRSIGLYLNPNALPTLHLSKPTEDWEILD